MIIPTIREKSNEFGLMLPDEMAETLLGFQTDLLYYDLKILKLKDLLILGTLWTLQSTQLQDHFVTPDIIVQSLLRARYLPLYLSTTPLIEKLTKAEDFEGRNDALNDSLHKFMVLDDPDNIEGILQDADFTEVSDNDIHVGIAVAEATLAQVNKVLKAQGIDFEFQRFDAVDYDAYMLVHRKENLKGTAKRVRDAAKV